MAMDFEIVDATLRDGSNANKFSFTGEDTYNIVQCLEKGGIKWIEVGHGHGLGASERTKNKARESDETYIRTAKSAVKSDKTKIGCFFIQQIGTKEDIAHAVDWGLDFIRIGPNATTSEIEGSKKFISHAKEKGLTVHCCIRKAYVMSPNELSKYIEGIGSAGADAVIVMDSAGTLLPNQSKEYVYAIKDKLRGNSEIKVGYHGHNNLSMATACSLAAIEAGADYVDGCLKGYGRSAGNAATELLVAVLTRMGYFKGDYLLLQDAAERFIGNKAYEQLDWSALVLGLSGFHSSYWEKAKEIALSHGLEPRKFVIEICRKDRVNPSEKLMLSIAQGLKE